MSGDAARAKSIFLAAIENHRPEQWPAFLADSCGEDAALRAAVEKLLASYQQLGSFHEPPAMDLSPQPTSAMSPTLETAAQKRDPHHRG